MGKNHSIRNSQQMPHKMDMVFPTPHISELYLVLAGDDVELVGLLMSHQHRLSEKALNFKPAPILFSQAHSENTSANPAHPREPSPPPHNKETKGNVKARHYLPKNPYGDHTDEIETRQETVALLDEALKNTNQRSQTRQERADLSNKRSNLRDKIYELQLQHMLAEKEAHNKATPDTDALIQARLKFEQIYSELELNNNRSVKTDGSQTASAIYLRKHSAKQRLNKCQYAWINIEYRFKQGALLAPPIMDIMNKSGWHEYNEFQSVVPLHLNTQRSNFRRRRKNR